MNTSGHALAKHDPAYQPAASKVCLPVAELVIIAAAIARPPFLDLKAAGQFIEQLPQEADAAGTRCLPILRGRYASWLFRTSAVECGGRMNGWVMANLVAAAAAVIFTLHCTSSKQSPKLY